MALNKATWNCARFEKWESERETKREEGAERERERARDDFLIIFLNDTSALHPGCVIVITVPLFLGGSAASQQQ